MPQLGVIIPVLEADRPELRHLLAELNPWREQNVLTVTVVEGGSTQSVGPSWAEKLTDQWLVTAVGRGHQLQHGVQHTTEPMCWFLHADTTDIAAAALWLTAESRRWGRFDVRLAPGNSMLKVVAGMMNWRSRQTGICTGDQGLFVSRELLQRAGGWPRQALMEDVELSRRLGRITRLQAPAVILTASARRWQTQGVWRTICLMWSLRVAYFLGVHPARLHRWYYPESKQREASA